jgi:DNA invertase Pin-like site-specific DNA recombinase
MNTEVRVGVSEVVVGYVRVSTDEQGRSGLGLEAQRSVIRSECERRGWSLSGIEEDVASGGSTARRPGLEQAIAACRSGAVGGIVVAKLDRLTRSVVDLSKLVADAGKRNYNVVVIDIGLDLSTPHGNLVANLLASVAQWEREIISQRIREALAVKKAQGVRLGRPRTMDEDVRQRITRMRKRGKTLSEIAETLNRTGAPTAHGGRQWYPSTVQKALRHSSVG